MNRLDAQHYARRHSLDQLWQAFTETQAARFLAGNFRGTAPCIVPVTKRSVMPHFTIFLVGAQILVSGRRVKGGEAIACNGPGGPPLMRCPRVGQLGAEGDGCALATGSV